MVSKTRITVTALAIGCLVWLAGTATPARAQTGNWNNLANAFPGNGNTANAAGQVPATIRGPDTALLLTDGSVIMHDICTEHWYRLLPLNTGTFANSYINGQWSATAVGDNASIASMIGVTGEPANRPYGPLFYASQVLADGRVIVNGGEADYSQQSGNPLAFRCSTNPAVDLTKGSLYNPQTNTWVPVTPPPGWATIGDAASVLLGVNNITGGYSASSYMLQNCCDAGLVGQQAAVASITGNNVAWTITSAGKADANNEEGWALLANGQVLTVDTHPCNNPGVCNPTNTERFDPAQNQWLNAGQTPTTLVSQNPQNETGPAVGIGFNMVIAFGSVDAIALYRFPNNWTAQTAFPGNLAVPDGPASLLPNGNILVQTGLGFLAPSTFFEFNSSILTPSNTGPAAPIATVNQPQCNSGTPNTTNVAAFQGRMLLLPTGQVLWDAGEAARCTAIYTTTTAGNPNPVMRPPPHINTISSATLT